jgi:hypothetical protein
MTVQDDFPWIHRLIGEFDVQFFRVRAHHPLQKRELINDTSTCRKLTTLTVEVGTENHMAEL